MKEDIGAYAYIILQDGEEIKRGAKKIMRETNNRAEIKAIMEGVLSLEEGSEITLYSDSQYALGVLSGRYKAKKNVDLIYKYRKEVKERSYDITYKWVRGHSGDKWNDLCDALCNEAAGIDLNARVRRFQLASLRDDELLELHSEIKEELNKRNL